MSLPEIPGVISSAEVAATAAAIGHVAVPEMQARGVSARIATGAVAAGGTLGILIPPSIMLVVFGDVMQIPIGDLFAGALIPGLMLGGFYALVTIGEALSLRVKDDDAFLNDVAIGPDGAAYFTNSNEPQIFRVAKEHGTWSATLWADAGDTIYGDDGDGSTPDGADVIAGDNARITRSTMLESQGLPSPGSEPLLHQQGEPLRVRVWPKTRVR